MLLLHRRLGRSTAELESRVFTVGFRVSIAAGHAGDVLGDRWVVAGGGNNAAGCNDTVSLDMSPLANDASQPLRWTQTTQAQLFLSFFGPHW